MRQPQSSSTTIAGFPALSAPGRADRPTLLFIHGAFVDHLPFAPWMEELARRGWSGVAAARRGRCGLAPARADGLTIADYVADTLKVIDAMDSAPILIGHSLGGLIAQKIAELGRCRAAVLAAPAPAGMLTAQAVALPTFLPMMPKILTGRPLLPTPGGCATIALNRIPKTDHVRLHASLTPESGKVYREMIFGSVRVDEGKVKCPMFVLGGEDDRIVSAGLMRATAKKYGAPLKLYANHAHWLMEEPGWVTIVADIDRWLCETVLRETSPPLRIAS